MDNIENGVYAEKALLGTLFIEPKLIDNVAETLRPEEFYVGRNRIIYSTFLRIYSRGEYPDVTLVCEELKKSGTLNQAGGYEYIAELIADGPSFDNISEYERIIKYNATVRRIRKANETVSAILSAGNYDNITELCSAVEDSILRATKPDTRDTETAGISGLITETLKKVHRRIENGGEPDGIMTGYRSIDRMTAGLHPANLIILAARPAMGKTSLALNILENLTVHQKKHALFFSLEMGREELTERMITSYSYVSASKVRTGNMTEEEWSYFQQAGEILMEGNLEIIDTPALRLSEIGTIARRQNRTEKLDLIVIDYLQLILSENRRRENRQAEIAEISRGLKQLARELDCPVLCLSQLSRSPEYRVDKRPVLSDLRDSGSIEQDADIVMFLYRDGYYNPESEDQRTTELTIAKQRNGPTGTVLLDWIGDFTRFFDIEESDEYIQPEYEEGY